MVARIAVFAVRHELLHSPQIFIGDREHLTRQILLLRIHIGDPQTDQTHLFAVHVLANGHRLFRGLLHSLVLLR